MHEKQHARVKRQQEEVLSPSTPEPVTGAVPDAPASTTYSSSSLSSSSDCSSSSDSSVYSSDCTDSDYSSSSYEYYSSEVDEGDDEGPTLPSEKEEEGGVGEGGDGSQDPELGTDDGTTGDEQLPPVDAQAASVLGTEPSQVEPPLTSPLQASPQPEGAD